MRVQIASDIHVEFFPSAAAAFASVFGPAPVVPSAPSLALLGDIGYVNSPTYADFLRLCTHTWGEIYLLIGNHEFWREKRGGQFVRGGSHARAAEIVAEINAESAAAAPQRGHIRLLNRTAFDPAEGEGRVRVIGASLWFDVPLPAERSDGDAAFLSALNHGCADFSNVKAGKEMLSIEIVREWHRGDAAFIAEELAAARERGQTVLVLTHHAPVLDARTLAAAEAPNAAVIAYLADARAREAGGGAASLAPTLSREDAARAAAHVSSGADCRALLAQRTVWCFGHTHHAVDFEEGGARLLSNPAGYVHETDVRARFDAGCVVEVGGDLAGVTTPTIR